MKLGRVPIGNPTEPAKAEKSSARREEPGARGTHTLTRRNTRRHIRGII
jgi:hypothetical protein